MFTNIHDRIESAINSSVISGYGAVVGFASEAVIAGIALYMLLACLAALRGIAGEGLGHIIVQGIKCSLVLAAVQSGIGGITAISVMQWPDILIGLAGGSANDAGGMAQSFYDDTFEIVEKISSSVTIQDFALSDPSPFFASMFAYCLVWLAGFIPLLAAAILASIIVALVLFLKLALACTALFGPIFVGCLLFDSTRNMFFVWMQSALGYALATAIIALVIGFLGTVMENMTADIFDYAEIALNAPITDEETVLDESFNAMLAAVTAFVGMIGVIIVGGFLLMQAQSIAQGMSGGGGGSAAAAVGGLIPSPRTAWGATKMGVSGGFKLGRMSYSATKGAGGAMGGAAKQAGRFAGQMKSRISTMRAASSNS